MKSRSSCLKTCKNRTKPPGAARQRRSGRSSFSFYWQFPASADFLPQRLLIRVRAVNDSRMIMHHARPVPLKRRDIRADKPDVVGVVMRRQNMGDLAHPDALFLDGPVKRGQRSRKIGVDQQPAARSLHKKGVGIAVPQLFYHRTTPGTKRGRGAAGIRPRRRGGRPSRPRRASPSARGAARASPPGLRG